MTVKHMLKYNFRLNIVHDLHSPCPGCSCTYSHLKFAKFFEHCNFQNNVILGKYWWNPFGNIPFGEHALWEHPRGGDIPVGGTSLWVTKSVKLPLKWSRQLILSNSQTRSLYPWYMLYMSSVEHIFHLCISLDEVGNPCLFDSLGKMEHIFRLCISL